MSDLLKNFADLSQEKQQFLLLRLKQQREKTVNQQIIPQQNRELNSFPLSFAQQRLWFLHQLDSDIANYVIPLAVKVTGKLQIPALTASLREIMFRHWSLRTNFRSDMGQPFQVIQADGDWQLKIVDLQTLTNTDQQAETKRFAQQIAQDAFDLEHEPLVRTTLVVLAPTVHILLVCMHHIITDGWSIGIFTQELATLYPAYCNQQPNPLPKLPLQYVDFACWQRQWLQGEVLEKQLNYWRQQLAAAPALLELPTTRPRPAIQTTSGASYDFSLSPDLSQSLTQLSQQAGVTLFMTLLAAFDILLYRYSGNTDILVGTPIANRNRAEIEGLIGFFVNTLVLRTDLSGQPSFTQLLNRVREVALGAYAHQDLPFELLVDEIQPERSLSHTPLFQVMFILQNAPATDIELPELTLSPMAVDNPTVNFDLTLNVTETETGLVGNWLYNTDLFDQEMIARLNHHFQNLLNGIVSNPEQVIEELPLMTATDEEQLLAQAVGSTFDYSLDRSIPELFAIQAAQTPQAIALICDEEQLTYEQLDHQVNNLAQQLSNLGIKLQTVVGLCVQRSLDMVVGILAILKVGAIYLPLDPEYPIERLNLMMTDAGVGALVAYRHCLPSNLPVVPCLDLNESVTVLSNPLTLPPIKPSDPAYLLYTSGSTGRPKGVLVEHQALVAHCLGICDHYQLQPSDRILQFASLNFDPALEQLLPALITGCSVVLRGTNVWSPEELLTQIQNTGITVANLPTAYWRQVVLILHSQGMSLSAKLRLMIVGGEAMLPTDIQPWQSLSTESVKLLNAYGPTEATITALTFAVPRDFHGDRLPIGRPLTNRCAYIIDSIGKLCPIGIPGELHLGGASLARGYYQQPELTAEKFIPDYFSPDVKARMYRTGDLAYYLPDGAIAYLGRLDQQVKIRGFRIELEEIAVTLCQHQDIQSAIVNLYAQVSGSPRLVAYYVTDQERSLTTEELRQFLAATLPDYMLPAAYVRLEQLPLAPNGKIDRRALPNPLPNIEPHLDLVLPSTPTEIALAQIWTEVIGVPQVGIHDNFFAIGGDSIMSLQIIARAHQVGIQLTPKQIFAHQSIAQLANVAGTAQPIQAEQGIITGKVPLTPIQQWFFAQNLPNPHHFNQTILLNVPADLVTSRLQQVLTEIVSHHDALRLQFQLTEKGWQQSNATLGLLPQLQVVNLADVHPESQGAILTQICSQHQASLDLTAGCLLKATLFQMGADSPQRLLLVVHHLVVDGISWRILLDDIQKAYKQLSQGQAIAFFAKTTAWQYWAEQLTAYATNLTAELPYWQEQISHSVTPIPLDQLGDNTVASLETISVSLSATATQDLLHRVPTAYQTQINDLLLTALAQTMTAWTGDATTYCELEGHGREDLFPDVDISRTIGWFTTLFPVRLTLPTTSHPGSLLKTVKEQLRSIPQKGISYGLLRYCLQEPTLTAQPPAPISFNYLGQFDQTFDSQSYFQVASESAGATQSLDGQRSHILEVNGLIADGQLQMEWSYSSHLHHCQTIEQLAQNFITNLQALIDHCLEPTAGGYTPTDFPLVNLSQIELDDLLGDDWQQVTDLYPLSPMQRGMLFHSLYTPDADVYVEQLQCTLRGQLDTQAFRQAWEQVFARHEIFRTGFFWENLVEPLQCVRQQVSLPLTLHDWQSQDTQSQQQQLAALVISERRGFDLAKPPLIRLHLVQLAPDIYEFIWSHHHLLLDGWSLSLVLQEVFTCYHVYQHSQPIQLAPTTPYQTYIAWLQAQDLVAAKTFWQEQLQGIIAPTPLITASTAELTTGYQTVQIQLGIAPTANLQAFARQHQLTLSNLVQGAYALTLARYSGESEVVFGVTMAGRPPLLAGLESMVGLFINTLPLRVSVTDQYRLLPWLQTLQAQQVACEQYVYSPLVEIQAQSQIPQDLPLFESIVVFENYPVSTATVSSEGGVEIVAVTSSEQTNYPITLIAGAGTELTLKIIYDASRFTPEMIERWLGHLQMLLTNMAAQPDRQITKLPMLTAAERSQLLDWQSPVTPVTMGLQERFSQQVSLTPQAVAVVCGDRQLTYQALDAKANQLAHYLRSLGIDADVLVGVCLNRSLELAIAILAILKAGGAYVPLDPSYPSDRLGFMLTDTQIPVLLTSQGLAASLPEHTAHSICLDTDWSLVADYTTTAIVTVVQPEHLGYVIYTSGSTGLPKGVAMPQGALTNLIQWQLTHSCVPAGCTLQFAPISFDVSFQELFATWCGGGKLVLISESDRRDPAALLELIQTQQVERLFLPFVALQQIAETATSRGVIPSSLREIITAGEQLQITSAISNFFTKLPDCVLHNQYGPSESHVVSAFTLTGAVENWPVLPPIGRAITNTQLYILDQHRQPVALGVPGELYIGGNCLAHGYLHRTDLTATKFIPHPFDSSPDAKLYQSGDLARYLPDGNIEYLGRIDDQVKIRGYRIEVGEIENHLSHHPQIQQVAVLARNDVPGDRRLVAYLVTQSQQTLTIDDLHSYLGKRLPKYMLPVACVCLTQLPLTPSGKIDRRSLPVPTYQRYRHTAYIAPHSQLEYQLAQIWSEVLGVPQIGRNDHFFQLGGHSLLATRLISRIRTVCQVDLSLRAVFTSPTIAELAVAIAQIATTEPVPPIVPVSIDQPLPLSFAQQRLWFLAQLQPGNIAANLSTAVRLTGNLQISALEHSLQTIYQRHTALRTNFVSINDQPHQIIRSDDNWQFSLVDLRGETAPAIEQLMITAAQQPFDLGQNPLMRCQLIQLSDSDFLLLVCMHHMITDGWSIGIFTQELATLYPAYSAGQPNPLPELPLQYVDFACWQRQWLQGEVLEKQLDYWRQQLAAAPALLELPTTRPRPAIQTTNGASYEFSLSLDLSQKLAQLSQQAGVTLFMTLLAAFDILLYRYSGQTDILVGTPIANRNRTEIEGLIGFFVNTLVLRTDLSGQPNFTQLLNRVREVALGAYAHQDLPFELLVEAIQPQRSLSHTTLFQVMFVLQNTPVTDIELPELTLSPVTVDISTVNFDLILNVMETETGLVSSWEYNTDLFDDAAIARMARHFQTLLEGIVANPEQCISQLPLLTATEQQQLLVEWNQTQKDYSHEQCIHELFELQAELTPDQVAIVFENQQLTYQELNSRANQLAHHLRDLGVKPDVLVGLCVERSLEMIVGLLGILKAGGAYLPLDPDYPQERLSFMLSDSQVTVLLTQQRLLEKLPQHEAQVVCLDIGWQIISQLEQENYISEVSPTNLAYIIYTSGSTGQPKGVMIQHQSLVNFTQTAIIKYGLKSSDRILQFASISFDVAAEEIYPGLSCGATLILRNEEMLSSITTFVQKCRDWELTVLDLPTVYWHQITLELAQEIWQLPNSLRLVIIGGESALPTQLKLWQQYVNERPQLINAYGPTETTIEATLCNLSSLASTEYELEVSIGRPIDNVHVYILDQNLQPLPIGIPGELHIGGAGLAKGYLNRPELTQEKFIPHPFSNEYQARLYKTGDLVRFQSNGSIEFLGRIDNQVKIRGFRIELGEIEAIISQHPIVQTVAVIAREDVSGDQRLVAYLVINQQVEPTINEWRQFLGQKLPDYMIPSAFVYLESLPLTPNGKVDKKNLPTPEFHRHLQDIFVTPRNPVEEILAKIWIDVLGVEQVGIYDNFFELGGHSLLATQLISRVRTTFKVELPLRSLFEAATVAELAQCIQQWLQDVPLSNVPKLEAFPRNRQLPLSFAQQRLWFLNQLQPDDIAYNMPLAVKLQGQCKLNILEQSLSEIIRRHEALRTNFITENGQPVQIIHPADSWQMAMIDLQHLPLTEQEIEIQRLATAEAQKPFALETDLLLRASVLVLSDTEHILLLTMHHIVSDGWSIGIFTQELATLYPAYSAGQPNPLPELPLQYVDFACWQRQWLQGEVLEKQLDYWRQQLAAAPALLELPTTRPRPAIQTTNGASYEFSLSLDLSQKLAQLSQQAGVTLFMTLLAAFDILLYRYSGQTDILVGTPIANRNRTEIEGLIGFFVNTLVLRTDLSGQPNFTQLLNRVREVALGAYAHQDLPFELLVEAIQPQRSLSHTTLFQVMFVLQNTPVTDIELPELTLSPVTVDISTVNFDLILNVMETETGLVGSWEYNTDLFDDAAIARMARHFQTLLEGIVANPEQCISQLPLLPPWEHQKLLVEWNQTQREYPHKCIHQLFVEQVERTPNAVAVVFGNQQLTYQELNSRANQLAHYLQELGVKPDNLIGICIERSLDIFVGILGILKAGGAYLPLDPDYPQERLDYMFRDSQVSMLLTTKKLVTQIPEHYLQVVYLDADWDVIATKSQQNPVSEVKPENLAYLIYTSGSTGRPKGVMVRHCSLVNAYLGWEEAYQLRTITTSHLQMANFSFDVFTGDLVRALCSGAKLVVCPREWLLAPELLYNLMREQKVDCAEFVPPVIRNLMAYLEKTGQNLDFMRVLVVGSDSWYVKEYEEFQRFCGLETRLINSYGVSEATIDSCYFETSNINLPVEALVPIGRPFPNVKIYILDSHLQPVPIGVPGELYIGGVGLAKGYLNRPELTQKKFIPHPFSDECQARLYRTGDLVRFQSNGDIEFFGRIDNQVKIRGFRIELGEIEAALSQHPQVCETVVIAREDQGRDKQLVAYVVANLNDQCLRSQIDEWQTDYISDWQNLYEQNYQQVFKTQDFDFNINGWNSSYTGLPIPAEEMREWVDYTVKRILELQPKRVLEIGCGSGLLLSRIAPQCSHYFGMDYSQAALRYVEQMQQYVNGLENVTLLHRMADDFQGIETEVFDTVIINSVIQYSPSISYLLRVIENSVSAVKSKGFIFIRDVRNLLLFEIHHTSVQLHQASNKLSLEKLRQRIQQRLTQEEELLIDPTFFISLKQHLPKVSNVQIQPKRGVCHNEFTKFRYDVILHIDDKKDCEQSPKITTNSLNIEWLDWQSQPLTLANIRQLLVSTQPEILGIRRILNARVQTDIKAWELLNDSTNLQTVNHLRQSLSKFPNLGIDPEDLWNLSLDLPYSVDINWSNSHTNGSYEVIFKLPSAIQTIDLLPEKISIVPWSAYANNPLQGKLIRKLIPQLRQFLEEKLPNYMVPAVFMLLQSIPLTVNGKVDRRRLPIPHVNSAAMDNNFVPPLDIVEQQLAEIWSEVLNIFPVGIRDNFFDLGGHSLLAVQLMAKIEQQFQANLPLATLFQNSTIQQLATFLRQPIDALIWSPLVAIKPNGNKRPFFCIPGAGGNPTYLYNLAHHLGQDQPFYALQSLGLDGKSKPHTRVEDMATYYIQAIQSIQPEGPYLLGGHSFGCGVAFEIAWQLQKMGQEVALLALLDPGAPEIDIDIDVEQQEIEMNDADWLNGIGLVLENFYGTSLEISSEVLKSLSVEEQLNYFQERLQAANLLPADIGIRQLHGLLQVFKIQHQIIYQPKEVLLSPITCFTANEIHDEFQDNSESLDNLALKWDQFSTQPLNLYVVPGNHWTMLNEPYIQLLAEQLTTCIEQSQKIV